MIPRAREAAAPRVRVTGSKWLVTRRAVQVLVLGAFLAGPLAGVWILNGTLASAVVLGTVPLTDPFIALQAMAAGQGLARDGLIGAAVVIAAYLVLGGRVYCSWICPVNIVADGAAWLKPKVRPRPVRQLSPSSRYWLLPFLLLASAVTGTIAWEWVNPITILHRGFLFGFGLGWLAVLGIFLFDLFVVPRGWCGHLCPVGAFYSLLGHGALLRVSAARRTACDDCMACFAVCPEPRVIGPALKGAEGSSPVIRSPNCVNCGRCIDVCQRNVFRFTSRFDTKTEALP